MTEMSPSKTPRCFSASPSNLEPSKSPPKSEIKGSPIKLDSFTKSGRSLTKHTQGTPELNRYHLQQQPYVRSRFSAASASLQKNPPHKKKEIICPDEKLPLDLTFLIYAVKQW